MGGNTSILKVLLELFLLSTHFPVQKPFCKSFVFFSLRTLPSSVSCKSFACLPAVAGHSYENCRVYINSSHFGTRPAAGLVTNWLSIISSARIASLHHPTRLHAPKRG
jgi:hypothetical protein